jgi:hypothetical protein
MTTKPVEKLRIENASTRLEPVLTLDGSPDLIISAPIMINTPHITPRIHMRMINAVGINKRENRSSLDSVNIMIMSRENTDPIRTKIPPIKDSVNATVKCLMGM